MMVDTILRFFSLIVFVLILVIIALGHVMVRERKSTTYDPWALFKNRFVGWIIMTLVLGATTGFFFISPTDGWVEIITEAIVASLMLS